MAAVAEASRRVLIPIDESEHSKRAFEFYLENLYRFGDGIIFTHICNMPNVSVSLKKDEETGMPVEEIKKSLDKKLKSIKKVVHDHYEKICADKKILSDVIVRSGNPGSGICDVVTEFDVGCIVIGSRGLSAVRRTFVGSVSDYVLHHARVPVTIVPPRIG